MYLNNNEERIIGKFSKNLSKYDKSNMLLLWENGSSILAKLDTCFEDEIDCENETCEELWSFSFKAILIFKNPPVFITQSNGFLINYHNFPKEILVDGVKIN